MKKRRVWSPGGGGKRDERGQVWVMGGVCVPGTWEVLREGPAERLAQWVDY